MYIVKGSCLVLANLIIPGGQIFHAVSEEFCCLPFGQQERLDRELEDSSFLELDSSNASKFSRHLVVLAPGACFRSNLHVGRLVEELCSRAETQGCAFRVVKVYFLLFPAP